MKKQICVYSALYKRKSQKAGRWSGQWPNEKENQQRTGKPPARRNAQCLSAAKLTARETVSQAVDQREKMTGRKIRMRKEKRWQPETIAVRFTAVEGVPGVRLQHIRPVLRDAPSPALLWETDVTGQGLGDVIDLNPSTTLLNIYTTVFSWE